MTDASVPSPGTPREVLANLGDLTRRVRAAQRGTWFPLLLLGLLCLGGILVDRLTFSVHTATSCSAPPGSVGLVFTSCLVTRTGSPLYWLIGLVVAYAATALFYVRRSRSRGVGTPVRPYVLAGIGIAALVTARTLWATHYPPGDPIDFWGLHIDPASGPAGFLNRLAGQAGTVGLPLLVLSWVERSRALLAFTLAYLAVELAPISSGWAGIAPLSPWSSLPGLVVPGVLLLLGALGFALAELPGRRGRS